MKSELAFSVQDPESHREDQLYQPEIRHETTLARALVGALAELEVEQAFGVIGGAIGVLFDALEESAITAHHFRHETGAAFAAAEAHFTGGKPTLLFTTTGPGLLNALTGITAARWEGAKVILISGCTGDAQRGRWATQETSSYTMPQDGLYGRGPIFDYALRLDDAAELPEVLRRIAAGLARPGGFIAHLALPIALQSSQVQVPAERSVLQQLRPGLPADEIDYVAGLLSGEPFAVWLGFGARKAAAQVCELVARSDAWVMASPRAKGIFPESHPRYLGVTGVGGHDEPAQFMKERRPRWTLVLGTRLGEATSYWDPDLVPSEGFIHVDLDPEVPGVAYPESHTIAVQAEISSFLEALLERLPTATENLDDDLRKVRLHPSAASADPLPAACQQPVRPQILMEALQRRVVLGSDAVVMAESGNAFAWCNHYLRFPGPERYRVSALFGSMGHSAAGVVGAALGRRGKAVAVVGDGSMLMNCEVSTAVQYQVPAVWVVLNDGGYGMCENGQQVLGLAADDLCFPKVDFVALARAMGADGMSVKSEDMLGVALEQALAADGPFVIDVHIDKSQRSPMMPRFESLLKQGSGKSVAGWTTH